jgi:virginiamycin B lyase
MKLPLRRPADITSGPDGALYAPDGSLGRLWRITTKGKVFYQEVGSRPAGVATCRDGALGVTDRTLDQVIRVTTRGEQTPYQLPDADSFPTDIVAGPDGALWFTEQLGNKVGRITTSGALTEYPVMSLGGAFGRPVRTKSSPDAITIGPGGNLWYASGNESKIGRLDIDC